MLKPFDSIVAREPPEGNCQVVHDRHTAISTLHPQSDKSRDDHVPERMAVAGCALE